MGESRAASPRPWPPRTFRLRDLVALVAASALVLGVARNLEVSRGSRRFGELVAIAVPLGCLIASVVAGARLGRSATRRLVAWGARRGGIAGLVASIATNLAILAIIAGLACVAVVALMGLIMGLVLLAER